MPHCEQSEPPSYILRPERATSPRIPTMRGRAHIDHAAGLSLDSSRSRGLPMDVQRKRHSRPAQDHLGVETWASTANPLASSRCTPPRTRELASDGDHCGSHIAACRRDNFHFSRRAPPQTSKAFARIRANNSAPIAAPESPSHLPRSFCMARKAR
jgi:hypothetical protein